MGGMKTPGKKISTAKVKAETVDFVDIPKKDEKAESNQENPKPLNEEEINLGDGKKKKGDEKVTIDFMNDSDMKDFVKKQSKVAPEEKKEDKKEDNITVDDLRQQVKDYEDDASKRFTKTDFEEFAKVFMDLVDLGISTLLRFYAKDTTASPYQLDVNAKSRVQYQMVLLFVKYQTKFSIEFMLVITLLICYSVPFMRARTMRKERKEFASVPQTHIETEDGEVIEKKPFRGPGNPKRKV